MKETRRKLQLTQGRFGVLVGLNDKEVSRIECGRRPPTRQQVETLNMINFIHDKGLSDEYLNKRFGYIFKKMYKKGMP